MLVKQVHAAITNPALQGANSPAGAVTNFAERMAVLWRTVVIIGGLAFVLYLLWGGVEWITAGGDKQKIETARGKITQGIIGLAILAASYVIVLFLEKALGIDLLNIKWPTITGGTR